MQNAGPLALIGGSEWQAGCDFDADLLEMSGGNEVLVVPTASAFENPDRVLAQAESWFEGLGAKVVPVPVLTRADAERENFAKQLSEARFIYLSDGSAQHLRSVLKSSQVFAAIVSAWRNGAVIAGAAAGATVLGDPMVDPRGGTFTLGLGLYRQMAFVPHWDRWSDLRARRMSHLAPKGVPVVEVQERTALIRSREGKWSVSGVGAAEIRLDREPIGVDALETYVEVS